MRIQESILAQILFSRVAKMWNTQIKQENTQKFLPKSLQESKWILTTLDEILPMRYVKHYITLAHIVKISFFLSNSVSFDKQYSNHILINWKFEMSAASLLFIT